MENQDHKLTIRPRFTASILFAAAAVISLFTFIGKYLTLFPNTLNIRTPTEAYILDNYFILEFRLNTESNIIIYFTAFILLVAASALSFMIALNKNAVKDKFRHSWFALSAVFLWLSIYTAAPLPDKHVKFYYVNWTDKNGWFEFRWALMLAGVLLLGFLLRKFLIHLEPRIRNLMFASTGLYYAGLFGIELFGGRYTSFYREQNLGLAVISFVAEIAAFGGLILMIYALLSYIEANIPNIRFVTQPKPSADGEYNQAFQPRRIIQIFIIASVVFGILSFIGQLFRLFPDSYSINTPLEESFLDIFIYQFGVNTEANMATHFNTLILVIVAALFFTITLLKISAKDKFRFGWLVLGLFVLYMSIDEQCVLHEKLNKVFSGWSNYNGWFEYKWLIPAIVGVGLLAVLFIPFFFHLENKFKALFVVAAVMYFAGAFGGEMFSGRYASAFGSKNITYSLMTTFEELLEFNGVNLLIYSLLHYIEMNFSNIRVTTKS